MCTLVSIAHILSKLYQGMVYFVLLMIFLLLLLLKMIKLRTELSKDLDDFFAAIYHSTSYHKHRAYAGFC